MPKNSNEVTTNNLKLNAQWLKNAARTLGMNGISTIADISPNMAGAGRVVASSISTVTSAASSVRRQQRPIQYLLESNKYVKLGKRAINNALSDLVHGKFSNTDRSPGDDMGGTSTGTYFGDMSDGADSDGGSGATQNIYNIDTKAIDNVSNAVNTQTKYQLQMGKANIDTMVAIASSSMTQNQKNSDAILTQVTEMNRGIQALVAYQNENMTKFISASMAYYDAAGKTLGTGKDATSTATSRSVIHDEGGLNVDAYIGRLKKQVVQQFQGTTAGFILQTIAESSDEIVNNPLEFVSKAVMEKAIPEVTKKAMKATDKVFGSFMTEMLLQMGDRWEADESEGLIGAAKRFAAKAFGINDKRATKIDRSGKITTEAAVFDGATRTAIIDELPKYARESTAYLRSMVELLGGDPNHALRGSRILNRETGKYQSMESFATDFASSIDEKVISAMDKSAFGKELRNMATQVGKNDAQVNTLNDAINKFFVAAERNGKGSINASDLSEGSDMSELIKNAGLDPKMQKFIRESIAGMVRNKTGFESFNEGRLRARRSRNARIDEISADTGMLRTSNLFRSGGSDDTIDVSQITAESLLPQKKSRSGINLPGARTRSIGDSVADALYGNGTAKLLGSANPRTMAMGSVGARLKTIEEILLRGVNVRIDNNPPWQGADGIGGSFGRGYHRYDQPIGPTPAPEPGNESTNESDDIDLSNINEIADEEMGQPPVPDTGRGSKVANTLAHARQAMYLMMTGNASLAMNEMSTMLGETMSGVASAANKHILEPLKNAILPTKEVTDENGNTSTQRVTVLEMVRDKFSSVTNSVKESILGKDEDGKVKPISSIFKEGMAEWRTTIFGDKDPEEIKKEIQDRVPDAVGGAMGGGLVGMLIGGPFMGALLGGAAGFAKKSKWFQDMMFGEVDADGNEIKKGLIPPSVKKYYDENKKSLTGGAAVGGLMGMVVGGPVLGAAAGIGATMLKKSDKFNELLFGKEETDEKTGMTKKVGGVLNLFKEVTGKYAKGTSENTKGLTAKAAVGVGGGLLLSLFTPLGPIGGAAAGLAASIATNGDKFRQFLFGKKDENGKVEEAGLFQKMGNNITAQVINPLRDGVIDFFEQSKDKVIDKMLSPMLTALQPLLNFGGRIYEKTLGRVASLAQNAASGFGSLLKTIGKKLYDKTLGKVGRGVKKVAGWAVSAATGAAGKTVGVLGKFAEKRNRRASLKRFNKEDHTQLIQKWTEQYNNNPALQDKSLDEFLDDMKSRHYYNYGEKIKDFFGTDEERKKAREATAQRVANRKELRKQSLLINELTGGKFSDTGATAKQAALDAYMQSSRYARGKGMNIKHYGRMSQEDIIKALTVDKSEDAKISEAQSETMDKQLEAQKEAAGTLGKIYDWLEAVGRKVTGADDPERQQKREDRKAAKSAKSTAKQERKEAAKREALKRKEDYENALNETAQSTAATHGAQIDQKINSIADKWKSAESEILKGLKSNNPTIKKAAKEAYSAFFDEDGDRIIGSSAKEAHDINANKRKAYALFTETAHSRKANATQEGFLGSGLLGKIPGMGLVDRGLGKIGSLRSYIHTKHMKQYAAGGVVEKGETAVVGERGPEIVQFGNRAHVLPNNSKIDVNVISMAPDVLKAVGAETAVQDVRIVGQNGLLATYGTSAKLGSKTNNSGKIENALEDENKLIRYDDVKQDNDDYEEDDERTPSLLEKILGLFGGDGGILSKLGLIAGGAGLIALLSNSDFRNLLKDTFSWALGENGPLQTANREIENAASGAHTTTDSTTGKAVSVVDAGTHAAKKDAGAISSALHDQLGTPAGLIATGKDLLLQHGASIATSRVGSLASGTVGLGGNIVKGGASLLNSGIRGVQSIGTAIASRGAPEAIGQGFASRFSAAFSSNTGSGILNSVSNGGGKVAAASSKLGGFFKTMGGAPAQLTGAAATIAADISWEATETSRHRSLTGDFGFGNAGGYRAESKTAKTVTSAGLGLAATMATAAIINIWHPGGWIVLISAGIVAIAAAIAAVVNHLVGWVQDKSDREYSIRSNSAKLNLVINSGITYNDSTMNPRYVYCAQESDRVLGFDEGVFVGEADVCMANLLYTIKENLTSSPGAEVLLYDLINNMAVQGVPFACKIAGSSNICSADGAHANSDFGSPIVTEDSGFLKGSKTQVTKNRCEKNIDAIMSDVSENVSRNSGTDHQWSMDDLEAVYNAGKDVNKALQKVGILKDGGKTVNTKGFKGTPNSGKNDSGWKALDKLTREKGSYFLAKCIVYINSKVDTKNGQQWVDQNKDSLEMLLKGLADFLEKESGMTAEEMKEAGYSDEDIKKITGSRETAESDPAGELAQSTGAITHDTEQVYDSVNKQSGIKPADKADISKELRFLTAAWAYSHPAELQRWVLEHPDESGVPKNFQNLISSWNDKSVISDKNTRKELRREMVNASLRYAMNHGDIFGLLPLIKWDDSFQTDSYGNDRYGVYSGTGWNIDAQEYGPGYIFRGSKKEGSGKLESLFSDSQLGYDTTPEDMHDILFGSKKENEGSEGNDPSKVSSSGLLGGEKGIFGGIANRIARHASEAAEALYTDKSTFLADNILAGIPTNSPPYINSNDELVSQDKESNDVLQGILNGVNAVADAVGSATAQVTAQATGGGMGGRGNIIPFYSQKDPRWAGASYDTNSTETMANAGCGPTALSMAVNGAGGMGPSPVDAANRLKSIGARDNTGTSWAGMDRGISSYGLKSDQTSNPGQNFVDSGINSGKPVILSGTSTDSDDPFTSQGHYVVVSGKDRNGNYVVNDPNESSPTIYSKEQVTRNAAKGWQVGGGRGKFHVVRGGKAEVIADAADGASKTSGVGKASSAVSAVGANTTAANAAADSSIRASKNKWLSIVQAVKKAIAAQQPGYNQSNWIDITVGGKTLKVRTDCSGFVTACLKYLGAVPEGQNLSSANYANPSDSVMLGTGFKPSGWPGWDSLEPGDIIALNGHVEIFAQNNGNRHFVWNCGSNSSVNNEGMTYTSHNDGYSTVWRIGEACSGGISNFDVTGGATATHTTSMSTDSSSSSGGGFFSKLLSWGSELTSRALGFMSGSMSLDEAKDWSSWKTGISGSSSAVSTSTSGYTGSSGVSAANLSSSELQKRVWDRLRKEGPYTQEGTAAVLGNLYAESGVRPNNVQNSCEERVGSDEEYTAKIDNGEYGAEQFSGDSAGYGLAQWTSSGRKKALYELAKSRGVSIADPDVQVDHLLNELKASYRQIHELLQTTTDVAQASYTVMHDFEAPKARDSEETKRTRESLSLGMLNTYGESENAESTDGVSKAVSSVGAKTAPVAGGAGGRGGSTTSPSTKQWRYNTTAAVSKGTSAAHSGAIRGSSAPINFSDYAPTKPHSQNGGRGINDDTAIKLLERIVQLLGSSDSKLDNLRYLSDIGSLNGGTTNNNFASFNSTNASSSSTNSNSGGVDKVSNSAYNDARRIVAG